MGKRVPVRLLLGGAYSAGDAGSIPDGSVRELVNFLPRPNRISTRSPFVYDGVLNVLGIASYDDRANHVNRAVALDTAFNLYLKGTTGETWGAAITGATTSRVSSFVNYRGLLFFTTVNSSGVPDGFYSFNGVTIDVDPTRNLLFGRSVALFNDRLYLLAPRATITNRLMPIPGVADYAYDVSIWTPTNATVANVSVNGTITGRVTATALTGAFVSILGTGFLAPVSASAHDRTFTWLSQLRGVSATYDVPLTLEMLAAYFWHANEVVALGYERVPVAANGFRYRCTTAGTTAAVEPVWPVAAGTVNDNGVIWTFIGSDVIASATAIVPSITKSRDFASFGVRAELPAASSTTAYGIGVRLRFGTLTELASIDVSYKDGLADGNTRKANRGQQVTDGDFAFPFFNVDTAQSATVDLFEDLIWCELGLPSSWSGNNSYRLSESSGVGQASIAASARLTEFKRQAYWVFQATTDPDIPIRREGTVHDGVGCIGPRALDTWEDVVFFIGESDIYMMEPGDTPQPICGDGMREEIMDQGAGWVESQGVYKTPILAIDKRKLILWAYTQKNKLYAYDLRAKLWSKHQVGDGFEVAAMLWNQNTGHMYVAFGAHGLARMDYETGATTGANDTIDNTGTTYAGTMSITFKAIEREDNEMPVEFKLEYITPRVSCKITGQQITGSYSFDKGETFPKSQTLSITSPTTGKDFKPIRLDCQQSDLSITPKITVTGKLGEVAGTLSPKIFGMIDLMKPYVTPENQTPGAANL